MERAMRITAAERVLLHLLPLWSARDPLRGATQEGIADATGLRRSHVPRAMKRLVADGAVEVREGRLQGRGRKVRLYALTEAGIRRAREILSGLQSEEVRFGDRRTTVGALAAELHVSPGEIVAGLDESGRYRPRQAALAVPATELLEREAELRALAEWVQGPVPAAVVVGSRGMGKTALGRAFVRAARRPVVWVDVPPDDAAALRRDFAGSLEMIGGRGLWDTLAQDIAAVKPLIVLDGYGEVSEAVVDEAASLLAAVAAAPGAKLLVLAQEATPSYCRFYGPAELRKGILLEVHLKGLSRETTKALLGNPAIAEEALRQVHLLTKGCPLYLVLIRDGNAVRLREVSRFTAAEVRLLMFSRGATR
jgi:DNA-binding MarR family transcriptional regulator